MAFLFKKKKAFTLIELMTTTLIMAIIICAAIPFAMKKDIQKRAVAGHVGIFECYYEGNTLKQHIRTKDGVETTRNANGNSCKFDPNADYAKGAKNFQIIAIGGGGAGGTYNDQGANDDKHTNAIHHRISNEDTLESEHLKHLRDHGKLSFGTLSNAGGVNAWYWNGQTENINRNCYRYFTRECGNCGGNRFPYNTTRECSCPNHFAAGSQFCEEISRTNNSNMDYLSIYNFGPRLCSLNRSINPNDGRDSLMEDDLPEEDIFQAIYKYYGIAGNYDRNGKVGDIVYNIKAPSGISSCACLNNPVKQVDGTCMGDVKRSDRGEAGLAYTFTTYTGKTRGAYIGNEFLTNDGSVDETGTGKLQNHCDSDLKLAKTTFGCGTAPNNNNTYNNDECSNESVRTAENRGFPKYYYRGNAYDSSVLGSTKNAIDSNSRPWYKKINMGYTSQEGDLKDYGGDVHFRIRVHNGEEGHAIVPRGEHGDNPMKNNARIVTAASSVSNLYDGFIPGHHGWSSANNPSDACTSPSNRYSADDSRWYRVYAQCSDSCCSFSCTCGSGSNTYTCCCDSGESDSDGWYDYYNGSAGNTKDAVATCCGVNSTNTSVNKTGNKYTCEHLNCCNNYKPGSKKYTLRYNTGQLVYEGTQRVEQSFREVERELNCGDPFFVYRKIQNVPFERAFVASAGQNGDVKVGAYPKLNETLTLVPGLGGNVISTGANVEANGKASIVKKSGGQVILSAQGGAKGASDKLNDTWVGPCMLFTHRANFDVNNPGCIARHDMIAKPTYNSLLMANMNFLNSVDVKAGDNYKDMPGLGGDGAYANVFPDRFLLSKAVRDQVLLETYFVGPKQSESYAERYGVKGLDVFWGEEYIGNGQFKREFDRRWNLLQTASNNFLSKTQHEGRVPNFTKATNGNNGAIVIIW